MWLYYKLLAATPLEVSKSTLGKGLGRGSRYSPIILNLKKKETNYFLRRLVFSRWRYPPRKSLKTFSGPISSFTTYSKEQDPSPQTKTEAFAQRVKLELTNFENQKSGIGWKGMYI